MEDVAVCRNRCVFCLIKIYSDLDRILRIFLFMRVWLNHIFDWYKIITAWIYLKVLYSLYEFQMHKLQKKAKHFWWQDVYDFLSVMRCLAFDLISIKTNVLSSVNNSFKKAMKIRMPKSVWFLLILKFDTRVI